MIDPDLVMHYRTGYSEDLLDLALNFSAMLGGIDTLYFDNLFFGEKLSVDDETGMLIGMVAVVDGVPVLDEDGRDLLRPFEERVRAASKGSRDQLRRVITGDLDAVRSILAERLDESDDRQRAVEGRMQDSLYDVQRRMEQIEQRIHELGKMKEAHNDPFRPGRTGAAVFDPMEDPAYNTAFRLLIGSFEQTIEEVDRMEREMERESDNY